MTNYNTKKALPYNQILCGESTPLLAAFPSESIDLVVTDPPYLINYRDRNGRSVKNDNNPDAVLPVYQQLYRVLKPHSYCISFYGWSRIAAFSQCWKEAGFRIGGHFVWPKPYTTRAGHVRYCHESAFLLVKGRPAFSDEPLADVQQWDYSGNKRHPTEKAVSIISPLIKAYSNPGDLVLDPFVGSGTTAVAALLNDRDYIGIELESRYCELAQQRLDGAARFVQHQTA